MISGHSFSPTISVPIFVILTIVSQVAVPCSKVLNDGLVLVSANYRAGTLVCVPVGMPTHIPCYQLKMIIIMYVLVKYSMLRFLNHQKLAWPTGQDLGDIMICTI